MIQNIGAIKAQNTMARNAETVSGSAYFCMATADESVKNATGIRRQTIMLPTIGG
jgi:hypothetical protein